MPFAEKISKFLKTIARIIKLVGFFITALFKGKTTILTIPSLVCLVIAVALFNWGQKDSFKVPFDIGMAFLTAALVTAFDSIKGSDALKIIRLFSIDPFKKTAIVIADFAVNRVVKEVAFNQETTKEDQGKSIKMFQVKEEDIIADLQEIPSLSSVDAFAANKILALL